LEDIVICSKCETPQKRVKLKKGERAICYYCGSELYKYIPRLREKILVSSISGFLMMLLGLIFPILQFNVGGMSKDFNLIDTIKFLIENGYVVVGVFTLFSVVLFPLIFFFLVIKLNFLADKKALEIITHLQEWIAFDIFVVAILVAMIKIFSYGEIIFSVGFVGFVGAFIALFFLTSIVKIEYYWELYYKNV
jgi:paraquat-inducible protein A